MYGDMIYCRNCKKTFKDTWAVRNTRIEHIIVNCPFCLSKDTLNATQFIEEFEAMIHDFKERVKLINKTMKLIKKEDDKS